MFFSETQYTIVTVVHFLHSLQVTLSEFGNGRPIAI